MVLVLLQERDSFFALLRFFQPASKSDKIRFLAEAFLCPATEFYFAPMLSSLNLAIDPSADNEQGMAENRMVLEYVFSNIFMSDGDSDAAAAAAADSSLVVSASAATISSSASASLPLAAPTVEPVSDRDERPHPAHVHVAAQSCAFISSATSTTVTASTATFVASEIGTQSAAALASVRSLPASATAVLLSPSFSSSSSSSSSDSPLPDPDSFQSPPSASLSTPSTSTPTSFSSSTSTSTSTLTSTSTTPFPAPDSTVDGSSPAPEHSLVIKCGDGSSAHATDEDTSALAGSSAGSGISEECKRQCKDLAQQLDFSHLKCDTAVHQLEGAELKIADLKDDGLRLSAEREALHVKLVITQTDLEKQGIQHNAAMSDLQASVDELMREHRASDARRERALQASDARHERALQASDARHERDMGAQRLELNLRIDNLTSQRAASEIRIDELAAELKQSNFYWKGSERALSRKTAESAQHCAELQNSLDAMKLKWSLVTVRQVSEYVMQNSPALEWAARHGKQPSSSAAPVVAASVAAASSPTASSSASAAAASPASGFALMRKQVVKIFDRRGVADLPPWFLTRSTDADFLDETAHAFEDIRVDRNGVIHPRRLSVSRAEMVSIIDTHPRGSDHAELGIACKFLLDVLDTFFAPECWSDRV